MGNLIVKLGGKYLVWSTVIDSFVTYGMTLKQLKTYIHKKNGEEGLRDLSPRLARVEEKGTSSLLDKSADETIWLNRAGPLETALHREEIVEFFVRQKKSPTSVTLAEMRNASVPCNPCVADNGDGTGGLCECWGSGVRYRVTKGGT